MLTTSSRQSTLNRYRAVHRCPTPENAPYEEFNMRCTKLPTVWTHYQKRRHLQAESTAKITNELDVLLAVYDYPAEHWLHLKTSNPIESTFSTVRLRTRVTRGAGSCKATLGMAYKLLDAAQARWHRIAGSPSSCRSSVPAPPSSTANYKIGAVSRCQRTGRRCQFQRRSSTTRDNFSSCLDRLCRCTLQRRVGAATSTCNLVVDTVLG